MNFISFLLVVVAFLTSICYAGTPLLEDIRKVTHVLKPGIEKDIDHDYDFQMFCRIGDKKNLVYYFRTATLRITSSAEDIKLMKGHSPQDVYLQYHDSATKWFLWVANVLPWRVRDTNFPTFNTSCVGIHTSRHYTAMVIIRPIDPWKVLTVAAGIALFFMAPQLSKSTLFFYSSGTLLGALAAALVLLFIFSKFLPKTKSGYFFISVIWTLAVYFVGETWKRFEELVHERLPYIVAYVVSGAIIAFLACYRWGPPQHPRTLDILRWGLQALGLVLIHFSSDFVEMSTAIIFLVIVYHNTNEYLKYHTEKYYRRWFPPKTRLLSEEEYITQGAIETQKGLEELKSFCSSPDSKPWKLVTRLKDPRRFSSFMEGNSHLNDDEILAYESEDDDAYTHRRALPNSSRSRHSNMNNGYAGVNNASTTGEMFTDDDDSNGEGLELENELELTDDEN